MTLNSEMVRLEELSHTISLQVSPNWSGEKAGMGCVLSEALSGAFGARR